jgi:TrmH family RNA methyltransferase
LKKTLQNFNTKNRIDIVSENILDSITDTVNHQGVIAAFEKPFVDMKLSKLIHQNKFPLIVILDRVSDPGNVGTIIRTAYGLGVDAVVLAECCDVWSPKALRSSMGLSLKIPTVEMTWQDLLQNEIFIDNHNLNSNNNNNNNKNNQSTKFQVVIADIDPLKNSIPYHKINFLSPTVLLVGSEARGVSEEAWRLANTQAICIPMSRNLESFNVAVASSIILSEAARQRDNNSYNA